MQESFIPLELRRTYAVVQAADGRTPEVQTWPHREVRLFALPMIAARVKCLFTGKSHIAVTFAFGDFSAEPIWRLESITRAAVWEFNLRDDEPPMNPTVNIDLDHSSVPRDIVAHLAQAPASCAGPKDVELSPRQPNLALLPSATATPLEGECADVAAFSQPHLRPFQLCRKIALEDEGGMEPLQLRG